MKINKKLVKTIGIRLMFAINVNFYVWLFMAMFNEGEVMVYFDHFGEAFIEYCIYIAIFPIIIYSICYEVKFYKRNKEKKKFKLFKFRKNK